MMKNKETTKKIIKVILTIAASIVSLLILLIIIEMPRWIGDYKYEIHLLKGEATICGYRGGENVVVPSKIGPFKIKYISNSTFKDNDNIKSVFIPADLDSSVEVWIDGCNNLETVEWEKGRKVIRDSIGRCGNIKHIIIPDGVERFEGYISFYNSDEDIYFPKSLYYFHTSGIDCDYLQEKHADKKYYVIGDGILLFYNGNLSEDIVIPDGIKSIGCLFYSDESATNRKLYMPDSIERIRMDIDENEEVFFGNEEFKEIEFYGFMEGTVVAPAGSYMENYCKENGYNFRAMTKEEEEIWKLKTTSVPPEEIAYQN